MCWQTKLRNQILFLMVWQFKNIHHSRCVWFLRLCVNQDESLPGIETNSVSSFNFTCQICIWVLVWRRQSRWNQSVFKVRLVSPLSGVDGSVRLVMRALVMCNSLLFFLFLFSLIKRVYVLHHVVTFLAERLQRRIKDPLMFPWENTQG